MYIRRYNRFVDLSISSTLPPPTGRNVKLYVAKSLQMQPVVCTYTQSTQVQVPSRIHVTRSRQIDDTLLSSKDYTEAREVCSYEDLITR